MAAIWQTKIEVVNLATRQVRVTGTRTDGASVRVSSIETTVNLAQAVAEKARLAANLKALDALQAATDAQKAIISVWEAGITAALNAGEV